MKNKFFNIRCINWGSLLGKPPHMVWVREEQKEIKLSSRAVHIMQMWEQWRMRSVPPVHTSESTVPFLGPSSNLFKIPVVVFEICTVPKWMTHLVVSMFTLAYQTCRVRKICILNGDLQVQNWDSFSLLHQHLEGINRSRLCVCPLGLSQLNHLTYTDLKFGTGSSMQLP